MTKELWTVKEILEIFEVDERFLSDLEQEELLCPLCREESPARLFPPEELEKLRLAKVLVEDMGVNLPGVEVILRMRQMMFEMRKQFDDILEDLAAELQRRGNETRPRQVAQKRSNTRRKDGAGHKVQGAR